MSGPDCTIAGQEDVNDMGTDQKGNVYVPSGSTDTVTVFAPNCGKKNASYYDPYGQPVDIGPAFAPRDGNRLEHARDYVFNIVGSSGSEYGNVAVCTIAKGCTSELTDPSINTLYAGAYDSAGNVWASYLNQENVPALIVWPKGKMPGEVVSGYINTGVGGLQFDGNGNLVAMNQTNTTSGAVSYTCTVGPAICTSNGSYTFNGRELYGKLALRDTLFDVADFEYGSIDVYSYPGFTYQYSYSQGLAQSLMVVGVTLKGVPIMGR